MARAYELKSIADYGVDPGIDIPGDEAKQAYDIGVRFVAYVSEWTMP